MIVTSKHRWDDPSHLDWSHNTSDMQHRPADICSWARRHPLWFSLPIVIIFNWFFMSHFKANGLWATRQGEDLWEKVPRLTEWSEMSRTHSETGRRRWRGNDVINNLLKFGHKRRQSRSSHPWLYSEVPIMARQKTTARGWHSTIKQIISSWRNRRTLIWGVEDGARRISVKGSS